MSAIPISERHRYVGASEVAALLGASPFTTAFALWHEKRGTLPRKDLDHAERVQAGKFLEPAIAAWAVEKWQWPLRKVDGHLEHATIPGFGASLDFEDASDGAPVETKNVDGLIFREHWSAEEDEIVDAPVHYLLQVQAQLACRPEAPHGWLLACVGGNRLYRGRIERHPESIALIEEAVREFWSSVREDREPKPDYGRDAAAISTLYRSIGQAPPVDLTRDNRAPELCATYAEAKEAEKRAADRAEAALAELKTIIGPAAKAIVTGFNVSSWHVPEKDIAYVRKAYRVYRITRRKD